jgi:amino acid transporter
MDKNSPTRPPGQENEPARSAAHAAGTRLKRLVIGQPRNLGDRSIFGHLSIAAFLAWVGLGADGLSSSCYGPPEAFRELYAYPHLGVYVAVGTALTVFIIAISYSQIIGLFPSGGGGYLVASKLLSPLAGMISGCALLIDYVLTITTSVASGADAVFSSLPPQYGQYKMAAALAVVALLTVMNMRGVKESALPLVPIFLVFVGTHAFAIIYTLVSKGPDLGGAILAVGQDTRNATTHLGMLGMLMMVLRAYAMGAGTFTGIEAVSNGLPILREPRVQTARRTMLYMAVSLAFTAMGLMLSYIVLRLPQAPLNNDPTQNAILFGSMTSGWAPGLGKTFILVTLASEGAILFVAAQAGFLDGPRVLASMAMDRWFPTRFAMLSDRLVTQNGILLMGIGSALLMVLSKGQVGFLLVLYSINVFITISLSQLGMVRHWWQTRGREAGWRRGLMINGLGLLLSSGILVSVVVVKFDEGGWITLLVTTGLAALALAVRHHYRRVGRMLQRLDSLVPKAPLQAVAPLPPLDEKAKTAILFVSGFNGVGLHSLLNIERLFGGIFRNFVFVHIGIVDAGNFKGVQEVDHLKAHVQGELAKYQAFCAREGYFSDCRFALGVDAVQEATRLLPDLLDKYPQAVFFGGQLVFGQDTRFSRWLHNSLVFELQRRLYGEGLPFVILPIRLQPGR